MNDRLPDLSTQWCGKTQPIHNDNHIAPPSHFFSGTFSWLSLIGEVTKNIAFDSGAINKKAVNNRGPNAGTKVGEFEGGDTAWFVAFQVGKPAMETFGDWQAGFGYRYVESDAVVDGFTDSNFGGGGTNVQGYTLGGFMALSPAVRLGLRWMSADEIAGPPLSSDVLQIDLNAKF